MKNFNLADKIAEELIQNCTISVEDKPIFIYGLRQGGYIFLNLTISIVIGLILGMVSQCIIFLIAYIPLRIYAGGYHAKTQSLCNILSIIVLIIALLFINFTNFNFYIYFIITFLSILIILLLGPVENVNKPLHKIEITVYKKKIKLILFMEISLTLIFKVLNITQISKSIVVAIAILTIILLLGKLKILNGGYLIEHE